MADLTLNINEALRADDQLRKTARAVLSDMLIAPDADMTFAQFQERLESWSAVGYAPFSAYIGGGDYEYHRAIYKAIMSSDSGARPRLMKLTLGVDLPDVTDRGTAISSSTGVVRVNFNRNFYFCQDVVATLKGGTVIGAPRVTNITESGFDLEILDRDNLRIIGTVSWEALGY